MEWVVMMGSRGGGSLVEHFGNLEDPEGTKGSGINFWTSSR